MLYFILPQDGFKSKTGHNEFVYDITYLAGSDTATINFSYFDKRVLSPDSIYFPVPADYQAPLKKLFIGTSGAKWHYRFSAKMPFEKLEEFFRPDESPIVVIKTDMGRIELSIGKKRWRENAGVNRKILTLIQYNQ